MYLAEIEYFLDVVSKRENNFNGLKSSIETLKVALGDA